jgi:hypothetical protein
MPKNTGFIKTFFSLKKNLKELCRWKLQSIPKEKVMKLSTLRKMDELQKRLKKYLNFQNRSPFLI